MLRKFVNTFSQLNLNPNIFKAIAACGYTKPTPIQAQSIPDILNGKDLVASAQTGTGKTAAFVLPALHRLSEQKPSKKTRVLILTPTRELASQITKAASIYGKFLRFNVVSLVGGMSYHHQIKDLARGADIIVATPGRLMDHMDSKRVDLSSVEMLVLDEADRMLDMGFIDDVQYIAKLTPANRQTLLFSATVDKELTNVVRHLLKNPVRIDLSNDKIAAPQIKQELYKANNAQHKLRLLKHLLNDKNMYKAIIFSATKINADKLAAQLRDEGFSAAALHGDLRQNVRNRTIEQLRRGKIQFLVATDVAARGIDISDITHVINYDLPKFCEDYVHRIGRTGRAGKSGIAISFVLPADSRNLQRIERFIGTRLKVMQDVEINDQNPRKNNDMSLEVLSLKKDRQTDHHRHDRHDRHDRNDRTARNDNYRPKHKPFNKDHLAADNNRDSRKSFEGRRDRTTSGDDRDSRKSFEGRRDRATSGNDRDSRKSFEGRRDRATSGNDRDSRKSFEGRRDRATSGDDRGRRSSNNEGRGRAFGKDNARPFKKRFANKDRNVSNDRDSRTK
jgi:superfamily II DNA/RNA helicase